MIKLKPYEAAYFSQLAYTNEREAFGNWKFLLGDARSNGYGYYGTAYKDEARKLIIISHRGTVNTANLIVDATIGLNIKPEACAEALKYSQFIREHYNSDGGYQVIETGHSLGGYYAELNGAEFPNTEVITFDSPGCGDLLRQKGANPANYRCYVTYPNPINVANEKFGKVIRIYLSTINFDKHALDHVSIDMFNPKNIAKKLLFNVCSFLLHTHSMENIKDAMDLTTGEPYLQREVKTWPSRSHYIDYYTNIDNYDFNEFLTELFSLYPPIKKINIRYESSLRNLGNYNLEDHFMIEPFPEGVSIEHKRAYLKRMLAMFFNYCLDDRLFERLVNSARLMIPDILPEKPLYTAGNPNLFFAYLDKNYRAAVDHPDDEFPRMMIEEKRFMDSLTSNVS